MISESSDVYALGDLEPEPEKPHYAQARGAFLQHLEAYENTRDGNLASVRFISTTISAAQLDGYLRQKLDNNNRLVVTNLFCSGQQVRLDPDVWAWIIQRL